jgi:glycosyltransferase involved in cell wall biosynthesis
MIRLMKWVEKRSVRYADRVIVTHDDAREVLERHRVPRERFGVVVNAPDETVFVPSAPMDRQDGRFTIISHGSQLRRYGYDTLVRAVALIGDRIPELKVELIGEGKHRSTLIELARELGVGHRFDFIPWVPFENIPARLASADLAVVPILLELALPNKLFEYSAVKLPVIISDLATLRDYYGDDAVRYFPPGDEKALADAILELYHDPDRRSALAEAAHSLYRERYAWDVTRRSYLEVYNSLFR